MGPSKRLHLSETSRTLSTVGVESSSARIVPPGSVILSTRAPIGHLIINDVPMAFNQGCRGLVPGRDLDAKYLFYFLSANVELLNDLGTGTTFKELSAGALASVRLPLPPLVEQERIVGVLDKAFEAIAAATANTRAVEHRVGELATDLTNTVGKWTTLGEEVEILAGFAFKSVEYTDAADGIRLLRGDNIVQGRLRWEDVKRWPKGHADDFARYQLAPDDVVIAMDRPWTKAGLKYARLTSADTPSLLLQRVARLRAKPSLTPGYLELVVASRAFERHVLDKAGGSGVPHISGTQITEFKFRRPTLEQQCELTKQATSFISELD